MINIEKIKCVFFDFDETLYIYRDHRSVKEQEWLRKVQDAKDVLELWNESYKSNAVQKFMNTLGSEGVVMCLLSAVETFTIAEYKKLWVEEVYGYDLLNYCVLERGHKFETVKRYADTHNLDKDSILVVDDNVETLEEVSNFGFQACTPLEVYEFVENN